MATGKRSYIVEVISKITGAKATKNDLLGIGDAAKQVEGPVKGFAGSLKILSGVAATLGITKIASEVLQFGRDAVKAADEARQAELRLEQAVRATGNAGGYTKDQLLGLASELGKRTIFDDEQIAGATAIAVTFTKIGREVFPEFLETAADVSALLGQDLNSSVVQLGKALNDPITGLTALTRIGVSFSATEKELIKDMVEANRVAEAQGEILRIIKTQGFEGAASAARNAFIPALGEVEEAWGEVQEGLGDVAQVFTPMLLSIAEDIHGVADELHDLRPAIAATFGDFVDLAGDAALAMQTLFAGLSIAAGPIAGTPLAQLAEQFAEAKRRLDEIEQGATQQSARRTLEKMWGDATIAAKGHADETARNAKELEKVRRAGEAVIDSLMTTGEKVADRFLEDREALVDMFTSGQLTGAKFTEQMDRLNDRLEEQLQHVSALSEAWEKLGVNVDLQTGLPKGASATPFGSFSAVADQGMADAMAKFIGDGLASDAAQQWWLDGIVEMDRHWAEVEAGQKRIWSDGSEQLAEALYNAGLQLAQVIAGLMQRLAADLLGTTDPTDQARRSADVGLDLTRDREQENRDLGRQVGQIAGTVGAAFTGPLAPFLAPIFSAIAGEIGAWIGGLFGGGSRPFASFDLMVENGELLVANLRENKRDADQVQQLGEAAIELLEETFAAFGGSVAGLPNLQFFEQNGKIEIRSNEAVLAIADTVEEAIQALVLQAVQLADVTGIAPEILAAIQQAAGEAGNDLAKFSAELEIIQQLTGIEYTNAVADAVDATEELIRAAIHYGLEFDDVAEGLEDSLSKLRDDALAPIREFLPEVDRTAEKFEQARENVALFNAQLQAEIDARQQLLIATEAQLAAMLATGATGPGVEKLQAELLALQQIIAQLTGQLIDPALIDAAEAEAGKRRRGGGGQRKAAREAFNQMLDDLLGGSELERIIADHRDQTEEILENARKFGTSSEIVEAALAALNAQLEQTMQDRFLDVATGLAQMTNDEEALQALQKIRMTLEIAQFEREIEILRLQGDLSAEQLAMLDQLLAKAKEFELGGFDDRGVSNKDNPPDRNPNPPAGGDEVWEDLGGGYWRNKFTGAIEYRSEGLGGGGDPFGGGPPANDNENAEMERALELLRSWQDLGKSAFVRDMERFTEEFDFLVDTLGRTPEVTAAAALALNDLLERALAPVTDLQEGLLFGEFSTLKSPEQLAEAQAQLAALIAGGDASDSAEIARLSQQVLSLAGQVFATGSAPYQDLFEQINMQLLEFQQNAIATAAEDALGVAVDQLAVQQATLKKMERLVELFEDGNQQAYGTYG